MSVVLTPLKEQDKDQMFEWINDIELVSKSAQYEPVNRSSHDSWFNNVRTDKDIYIYAIRLDDRLIGTCQLRINRKHNYADLQMRLGCERGKGYGADAMRQLVDVAFNDLELHRVQSEVYADSEPAIKFHKKVGFKVEGVLQGAAFQQDGYKDLLVMAITND